MTARETPPRRVPGRREIAAPPEVVRRLARASSTQTAELIWRLYSLRHPGQAFAPPSAGECISFINRHIDADKANRRERRAKERAIADAAAEAREGQR